MPPLWRMEFRFSAAHGIVMPYFARIWAAASAVRPIRLRRESKDTRIDTVGAPVLQRAQRVDGAGAAWKCELNAQS